MNPAFAQPAILGGPASQGRSLTFRLIPERKPAKALLQLAQIFDPAWGVVGIGLPLSQALSAEIPALRGFPALAGPGCAVPSTQQALWILLSNDDRSALFDRTQQVVQALADAFELDDALDTFIYAGGRDLTGYEDGTENPPEEERPAVALADGEPGYQSSSFVAVQRWQHDLRAFNGHPKSERDAMIGRERESNEELEEAPESAHVKRTAQEDFEPAAFMLRRSMPWSSGTAQGLEFIAYGHSLEAFEQVMRRMAGLEDGVVDALFRFSRPITGGYYWCPPIMGGRLDLRMLGKSFAV